MPRREDDEENRGRLRRLRGRRSPELKPMAYTVPHTACDHNPIHKYRNALAAAKRALTEIHETSDSSSDDASVRAASGLAEISEALEGEAL